MAAPILWAPGIFWFFLLENPHAHKIPPFRGGGGGSGFFFRKRGGSANFIFMGVGTFPIVTWKRALSCASLLQKNSVDISAPKKNI